MKSLREAITITHVELIMTLSYKYSSGEEGGSHAFERDLGARIDILANQWNATDKVDDRVRG